MAQDTALPLPVCRTLCGVGSRHQRPTAFLAPTLRDLMPDPRSMLDMEPAAARIVAAQRAANGSRSLRTMMWMAARLPRC